ncbi:MAG: tRNA (adenosine(37)-N6)-threonylcarbamoyltransferase complex dimerization subunit type 1 TsaB [Flavobacteriales bacterium]|nr:tRNA (adenosine(37)-N6)-threonylcarbamoyltransferase complex dimerization subunit type 1 TsaB [Flavobacteriales bacterium]MCB9193400.1 tRNA (adenosine(37)-N6)-threonylcarbamoyltransferase complex dimerization subunit type 1 TsaB [Flavobacteriales bacterium]
MATLLCIETATPLCAVALVRDGHILSSEAEAGDPTNAGKRYIHAERTNVLIQRVLDAADHRSVDLQGVAVGIGPGSYTGLRIGLSAAKGLCYALELPIIGIGTLDTLVAALKVTTSVQLRVNDILWPMIDARRMEVFTRSQGPSDPAGGPHHSLVLDERWCKGLTTAARHVVFGDGADKAVDLWRGRDHIIHVPGVRPVASAMAALAEDRFSRDAFDDLAYLVPTYGKEARPTRSRS